MLGTAGGERLLAFGWGFAKGAAILVPFGYLAFRVVSPLLTRVARTHNDELFLLVALSIGLGAAAVTQAAGLSLALGAFLAGLLISESDYAHETLARLLSLRDAFVALFFVTIGALIDPMAVVSNLPLLGAIVGLVVLGKLLVWTLVVWLFERPFWTALRAAVGLTQIGEFSFILVQVARTAGHVGDDVYNATLAASLITILINAVLMRVVPRWASTAQLAREARELTTAPPQPGNHRHVVLCGFGRVGGAVGEALETFGIPYTVIEIDPDVVKHLRRRGVASLFGDAAHHRILEEAGAAQAALAVVTVPEIDRARLVVSALRALNPGLPILARAHHGPAHEELIESGATRVVQPELEAAATLIRHALGRLSMPAPPIVAYLERFRDAIDLKAPRATTVQHPSARDPGGGRGRRRARRSVARRGARTRAIWCHRGHTHAWRRLDGDRSRRGDHPALGRPRAGLRPSLPPGCIPARRRWERAGVAPSLGRREPPEHSAGGREIGEGPAGRPGPIAVVRSGDAGRRAPPAGDSAC